MSNSTDINRPDLETQGKYSINLFGEELPLVELPLDHPRPPANSYFRGQIVRALTKDTTTNLDTIAASLDADRFDVILASLAGVIECLSSLGDIVLATATSDARDKDGPTTNGLLLRIGISKTSTAGELIVAAREAVREAGLRQDIPLAEALELTGTDTNALRVVTIPDGFSTHLNPRAADAFDLQEALGEYAASADLVLRVSGDDTCELHIDYDNEIFEATRMESLLDQITRFAQGLTRGTDTALADISLLSAEEQANLDAWNTTEKEFSRNSCIHELISQQITKTPDSTAVRFRDESLSYKELDQCANSLAKLLIDKGVGPDVLVGLCIPRSIDMIVATLAVLKAGGAYVPMDPTYPPDRLAYIREDSGIAVVLSRTDVEGVREIPGVMLVDELTLNTDEAIVNSAVTPDNLAYVIYTSGSTGKPKGVMIEHRQVANFFTGMDSSVGKDIGRWLAVTSLSFDISVLELLWTLARGFEVIIHSVEEEVVSASLLTSSFDASNMDFSLFYFGSDDGEVANLAGPEKYRLLMEGAKFADQSGFSAIWTPERHFHIFGGMFPSPSVAGSALAMITENLQIRSGSVVLPLHNPVQIAEEWQLVDNLSNGRAGLSFASGWQPNDFVFQPDNYENRHEIMYEGIETVRALWRGESRTAVGGDGKEVEFITRPRPVQEELPFWVTAGGSPATFERAGQIGANLLTHLLGQSYEELEEKIQVYRDAYTKAGHSGKGIVSLMLHTFVGENAEAVKEIVHDPLKNYLKGSVSLFKPFAEGLGLDMKNLTPDDEEVLAEHAFERYYETSGLFGTPASCVERIHKIKQLGIDEVACLIDFGIGRQDVLEHLPYLAQLRNLCSQSTSSSKDDYSIQGLIHANKISHLQCTPSMASMLLADKASHHALSSLDVMLVGGEAFPIQLAQQLKETIPNGRIVNMYGPTETTIWSSTWELDDLSDGMTIGTPIANTQFYILDRHGRRVPHGGIGELVIGGEGVTRGYYERPDLTSKQFVKNPFIAEDQRMYRTGDLARFRKDGTVDFLGRSDQQVKFRGFRIELGEIEAVLCEHDNVSESVVIVHGEGEDKRLVAYVVPTSNTEIVVEPIRDHLKARLTDYMVPTAYVVLNKLPLTPNEKVDRKALPAPDETNQAQAAEGEKPVNELESTIADIWKEVLNLPSVSTSDNFFDIGGHSLLVVHMLNQIRERCEQPIVMTDLFRFPTISSLAAYLGGDNNTQKEAAQAGHSRAAARKARLGKRARRRA